MIRPERDPADRCAWCRAGGPLHRYCPGRANCPCRDDAHPKPPPPEEVHVGW